MHSLDEPCVQSLLRIKHAVLFIILLQFVQSDFRKSMANGVTVPNRFWPVLQNVGRVAMYNLALIYQCL